MDSLIKRLQEAEAGSEQLDVAICVALQYGGANSDGAQNVRTDPDWSGDLLFEIGSEDCCCPIPKLTTSLDAIVALIGEKLPGMVLDLMHEAVERLCVDGWTESKPMGPQLALKLCVEFLTALQSQEPTP